MARRCGASQAARDAAQDAFFEFTVDSSRDVTVSLQGAMADAGAGRASCGGAGLWGRFAPASDRPGRGVRGPVPADPARRGAGVVERGGLENRCTRESTVGSNPTPSARYIHHFNWLESSVCA